MKRTATGLGVLSITRTNGLLSTKPVFIRYRRDGGSNCPYPDLLGNQLKNFTRPALRVDSPVAPIGWEIALPGGMWSLSPPPKFRGRRGGEASLLDGGLSFPRERGTRSKREASQASSRRKGGEGERADPAGEDIFPSNRTSGDSPQRTGSNKLIKLIDPDIT
jgi:hypothetical protein